MVVSQKKITLQSELNELLGMMEDRNFSQEFAENPTLALRNSGLRLDLADLTSLLSQDSDELNEFLDRLAEKIDITRLSFAMSTCCS